MSDDVTVDSWVSDGSHAVFNVKKVGNSKHIGPLGVETRKRKKYLLIGLIVLALVLVAVGGVLIGVLQKDSSTPSNSGSIVGGGTTTQGQDDSSSSQDDDSDKTNPPVVENDSESETSQTDSPGVENSQDDESEDDTDFPVLEETTVVTSNYLRVLNITDGENTGMDLAGNGQVLALLIDIENENVTSTVVRVLEASNPDNLNEEWLQRGSDFETTSEAEVSLSADGTSLAIGNPSGQGEVCVYEWDAQNWTLQECLSGDDDDDDEFGTLVQLGNKQVLAACARTYCQVYDLVSATWNNPRGKFDFGRTEVSAMSMTNDGNTILLATGRRSMVFSWNGSAWSIKGRPLRGGYYRRRTLGWRKNRTFRTDAALASNNGNVAVLSRSREHRHGRSYSGGGAIVYEYSQDSGGWTRRGYGCPDIDDDRRMLGRRGRRGRHGSRGRDDDKSWCRRSWNGCSSSSAEEEDNDDDNDSFAVSGDGSIVVLSTGTSLRQPPRRHYWWHKPSSSSSATNSSRDNIFGQGDNDSDHGGGGSVLVFEWDGSAWNQTGSVAEMSDSVLLGLSDDGETLAVGNNASIEIYNLTETL